MMLNLLFVFGLLVLTGLILWILHAKLLLPIRSGTCESIVITVSAFGDAPELEMQLRGLLWLRSNGMIPCTINVIDTGLTAEASAALHCFAADKDIIVTDERGTDIHGRNKRTVGDQRQHCLDHLSK
jgi:hypothetical protein